MRHDYVIVGAGSAGCALAARLSEEPEAQVLLIEAGGVDSAMEIQVPFLAGQLFKSKFDWDFDSEPEPELLGRRNYLPRGRMLGGSSSINLMVYIRGNRVDYDGWAEMGCEGWSYDDVLPYFIRAEDNERGADDYHGIGGPLSVSDSRSNHPLMDAWIEAAVELGFERNEDFNGGEQEGVGRYQTTQRDGMRASTATSYLHPVLERANLTLVTDALATRVLFEGKRAVGVEVEQAGQLVEHRADCEVILAAGAYQSPQLLMLSGIGPAADLEAFGIPVLESLPVGEGLQDHLVAPMLYLTNRESLLSAPTPENFDLLQRERRGPLTSHVAEAGGFVRTGLANSAPDVQLTAVPVMFSDEGLSVPTDHAVGWGPYVTSPSSRGRVALRSALPSAKPRIFNNFLGTAEDRQRMLEAMRMSMAIGEQPALREVIRAPHLTPDSDSEEDIMVFVRRRGQSGYHPTSTCAMGSIVDSELRVLGTEGLRVVDCSVMPAVPRGNTNAPAIMIAEKAADLIRGARAPREAGAARRTGPGVGAA